MEKNKDIHFIKKIILINVILPFFTFIYLQIFLNIYNPYMKLSLIERFLVATVKNIFIIEFLVLIIPIAILIGYFLKVVKDALSNPELIEKAKKRIVSFPLVIFIIYLIGYLAGVVVGYLIPSGVQLNKFIFSFLVTLFIGIFTFSFAFFYIDSIMLKVKKLYGMTIISKEQKELSLNMKYIIAFLSTSGLMFSIILYIGYYYYVKQSNVDTGDFILNAIINALIIIFFSLIKFLILNSNVRNEINNIRSVITSIKEGKYDLNKRIDIGSFDELGFLTSDMNQLLNFLCDIIERIRLISNNIQESNNFLLGAIDSNKKVFDSFIQSINKIIEGISDDFQNLKKIEKISKKLGDMTESTNEAILNQSNFVSESTSSVEEMTSNIHKVSEITRNGNKEFRHVLSIIEKGKISLQDAIKSINIIQNSSKDFFSFINTISDISERIKLLAINASIEAARAGKSGEGFAVVALEVRKLSEASSNSVNDIEIKLKEMNEKILEGAEKINIVIKIVENFFKNIEGVIKLFDEITESMIEEESGTKAIEIASNEVLNSNAILTDLSKKNEEIVNEMKNIFDYFYTSSQNIYILTQEQKEKNQNLMNINTNLLNSSELLKNSIKRLGDILNEFIKI